MLGQHASEQENIFVMDKSNVKRLTGSRGWFRRWHQWNHRGPHENATVGKADITGVRFRKEDSYQRRIWEYLSAHVNESLSWDSLEHVVFDPPL